MVVAAGNDGAAGTTLTNPAIDPYVIAVGAIDHNGTEKREDDRQASFSSVGSASRRPDILAPGRSIVSYRVPGSYLDEEHPTAVVRDEDGAAAVLPWQRHVAGHRGGGGRRRPDARRAADADAPTR